MVELKFDAHGWWNEQSATTLRELQKSGDVSGWFGVTTPPTQTPYFVSGAVDASSAIAAGMPEPAALAGRLTTPTKLLD